MLFLCFCIMEVAAQSTDPPVVSVDHWSVCLEIEINGLIDTDNFAGVRKDAAEGADIYDFSEPPPPPGGPRLAFKLPEPETNLKRTDFRPPFTDGATWDVVFARAGGGKLTVRDLDQVPDGMDVWLQFSNGATIKIPNGEPLSLPGNISAAKLIIGTDQYTSALVPGLLPLDFALKQNYPNPFNRATNISFSLPGSGHTRLEILNVLGQRVRILVDRDMPPGRYNVEWDGNNSSREMVASGVYFYKLSQENLNKYRKMLMLK
jgi:hypothetical protein